MSTANPYASPNPQPEDPPLVAQLAVEGEGMTVEFEQTFEDHITLNEYMWERKRPQWNRIGWLALGMWLFAILFIPGGPLGMESWSIAGSLFAFGAVLLVMWVRIVYMTRGVVRQTLQREYANNKNLTIFGLRRVTITPEYVFAASQLGQTAQRWRGVEKVLVYRDTILIFLSALAAIPLPRRAFNSDAHFQEFASQAQRYLHAHATTEQITVK